MSEKNFWNGEDTGPERKEMAGEKQDKAINNDQTGEKTATNVAGSDENNKKATIWLWAVGIIAAAALIVLAVVLNTGANTGEDTITEAAAGITTDNGDIKINWDNYNTTSVNLDNLTDSTYKITESGTYHLTGSYNGAIIVNVDHDSGKVRVILDGVEITNDSGPAIACLSADDLVIELVGENSVTDGETYSSDYDTDVRGAIYSADDLSFTGEGSLKVTAQFEDGIVGKDDLKFNSGTYTITAADDGIRGTDSVYIVAGVFDITSVGDAIKSTNETDADKGFVLIEDGDFTINSSTKGIKATNSVLIYDGTYNIVSKDDSIHSNNYVGIAGGNITVSSGDDGVHADKQLIIDAGKINVKKSYEGLEAQAITINGGEIAVVATDDGINAGGGADSSSRNRAGANAFDANEECVLTINGGELYVNAAGDGLDSNGYIYFNGGSVVVDGPTNNGDGALDSGLSITQNGGTVIAVGASGMAETLGNNSTVNNISVYLSGTQAAGTKISIKDSSDTEVLAHTAAKSFNHIAAGTSEFKSGETYTIYLNDAEYTSFTVSGVTTTVGNSGGNFNNMMQRGAGR